MNTNKILNNSVEKEGKREYHLDNWYRRGYWRNYKSGKRVWIEQQLIHAHNKSKDSKNTIYRITNKNKKD